MVLEPVTLDGECASLVPLASAHCDDLVAAAGDGDLHLLWYTTVPAPEAMPVEIDRRLKMRDGDTMLPFAVVDRASGRPVGMTTYMNIDAAIRRVEIGSHGTDSQFSALALNAECKYLMLAHAFETLNCIAIEFRTYFLNQRSRRAIERLGAKYDGVLHNHMILPCAIFVSIRS